MPRVFRRAALVVLVVAALVGPFARVPPAGADDPVTYTNSTGSVGGGPGAVALIGDSLIAQIEHLVPTAFGDDWYTHTSAAVQNMFRDRLPHAAAIAATEPEAVAIDLGSNDTYCVIVNAYNINPPCKFVPFTFAEAEADQRAMVSLFAPDTCVVGISIAWGDPTDAVWYDLLASGEVDGVIEWERYLVDHPDLRFDAFGHLAPAGVPAFADIVAQGTESICRPTAPPEQPLVVDTADDGYDLFVGDGVCRDPDGSCPLRAAIMEANARPGADEIAIDVPGVSVTDLGLFNEDTGRFGDLDVVGPLVIDGGGAVLDAAPGIDRLFDVHGGPFELRDLTIQGIETNGSAVLLAHGDAAVRLDVVTIQNTRPLNERVVRIESGSLTMVASQILANEGAGIVEVDGPVDISGSTFADNLSTRLGAITARGGGTIADTTFSGNGAALGGGVTAVGADPLVIQGSTFDQNVAVSGGAAALVGPHEVLQSTFTGNQATNGGAIVAVGPTVVGASTFDGNAATKSGGGLYSMGVPTISDTSFLENTARIGGGALIEYGAEIDGATFSGNHATSMGGGLVTTGAATVIESRFVANTAAVAGGGLASIAGDVAVTGSELSENQAPWGAGLVSAAAVTVDRSTLSANVASEQGGGALNVSELTVVESTVTGNQATGAAGIYTAAPGELADFPLGGTTSLSGSAVGDQVSGSDCGGSGTLVSLGANASTSSSCGLGASDDQQLLASLALGPLTDNGGPTRTHVPAAESSLVESGGLGCGPVDQRGFARPVGLCDVGSVERSLDP